MSDWWRVKEPEAVEDDKPVISPQPSYPPSYLPEQPPEDEGKEDHQRQLHGCLGAVSRHVGAILAGWLLPFPAIPGTVAGPLALQFSVAGMNLPFRWLGALLALGVVALLAGAVLGTVAGADLVDVLFTAVMKALSAIGARLLRVTAVRRALEFALLSVAWSFFTGALLWAPVQQFLLGGK
ncbi:hypothetical protein [Streptomyces monashensis]|uniref:Uncharacterized protein n=1 Tax=Streptomyces monashensis TaxID=1678012 RepID=A0A1S2QRX8_9ACTN|nr:hypothetical protein [Streptomyces monashensis]OIK08206.1 hypothetical protein BIV23_00210 [Streptomyces monashensis]